MTEERLGQALIHVVKVLKAGERLMATRLNLFQEFQVSDKGRTLARCGN